MSHDRHNVGDRDHRRPQYQNRHRHVDVGLGNTRSRSRSRSPDRKLEQRYRDKGRRNRSHSRDRHRDRNFASHHRRSLPFAARPLEKNDFEYYEPLFALYLDIQKQIILEDLDDKEARGRWKSFIGKWNRGELAEGWYDPDTLRRAQNSLRNNTKSPSPRRTPLLERELPGYAQAQSQPNETGGLADENEDEEDEYGPAMPRAAAASKGYKSGPAVPSLQDIELQQEHAREEREVAIEGLRQERRDHRKQEQVRLDELVPRAEAGTRERQLEKKRETAAANRSFAAAKTDAGGAMEIRDEDLMGGADGADEYRKMKSEAERRKNEREIRREEIHRARKAEREERVRAYREKEDQTMAGLIALAKQKYG